MERSIFHSDLNSFYASVECRYNPQLRGKPVSVCGSEEERHGIVLASTPEAKYFGVKTGETIREAREKCRDLIVVDCHMDRYVEFSHMAKEIYLQYSPLVEPMGLDENFLDMTGTRHLFGDAKTAANTIREHIKRELGLTVSIGASFNKSMAKLGSDYKKPDAVTEITKDNFKELVWPLPASDLLYVGPATAEKLRRIHVHTIGDLATFPLRYIEQRLGKNGIMLWRYANGIDNAPVREAGARDPDKSIGNSKTFPRDLETRKDIRVATMHLAESVAERLREKDYKCKVVQVSLRYSDLGGYQRQAQLPFPSRTAKRIGDAAYKLIMDNWNGEPLRGIGVRACSLTVEEYPQLSLLPELREEEKQEELEKSMQGLRDRYGHFCLQRGNMVADQDLAAIDIRDKASPHAIAFFRG